MSPSWRATTELPAETTMVPDVPSTSQSEEGSPKHTKERENPGFSPSFSSKTFYLIVWEDGPIVSGITYDFAGLGSISCCIVVTGK